MTGSSLYFASEIFRTSRHAAGHPLAIPRVSLATDLCRALAWLDNAAYIEATAAAECALRRFHDPAYIAAVRAAANAGCVTEADKQRFNLGVNGNAVYPDMFRRPATACGASLLAAERLAAGPAVIHNPAGGNHHARAARASGFCIFNDIVLAIVHLLAAGVRRIFYLDLDAHFGDAVQDAFHDDDRVFTVSIHEAGRWPMAAADTWTARPGGIHDRAGGAARNLPVPAGSGDSEYAFLMETVVLPLLAEFQPEVVVVQCGADALADDPMSRLDLSNAGLWHAVSLIADSAPRLLVLGGGGYNPWSVARCWAGVWATLNGFAIPDRLPPAAEALLRDVAWPQRPRRPRQDAWFTTLADAPRPRPLNDSVRLLAAMALLADRRRECGRRPDAARTDPP